jgi:hypothetical protein
MLIDKIDSNCKTNNDQAAKTHAIMAKANSWRIVMMADSTQPKIYHRPYA